MESNAKLEQLKKEIHDFSAQLKQLAEQKENKYKEKENIDKTLNSHIKIAKELRDKKAVLDKNIRELKETRTVLNNELKGLFTKFNETKQKQPKTKGPRESPGIIKKQIEAMQYSIETEGVSFEREQNYMERINRLKAQLKEVETEGENLGELKVAINKKKSDADSVHAEVQKTAGESSAIFKELSEKSESISKAKQDKVALQELLKKLKAEIDSITQRLSESLNEWSQMSKTTAPGQMQPVEKPEDVMGKLKSRKKLTKDDILLLQRGNRR